MNRDDVSPGSALWSPLAHMPSVLGNRTVVVAGDGAWVTTSDGRRLLDATAGLWHANVGHGRREIAEAAHRQLSTLETYHSFGAFSNDVALRLADRLADLSTITDPKVILTSGGSDSIETAAKLARRHWQLEGRHEKTMILSRADSYHGLHAYGSSLSGPAIYRDGYGTDTLVGGTRLFSSTDIHDLERLIADVGAERIAAIVTEPVIGSGGIIAPPAGYFELMQQLAREHDILLIVDEVITGFGRTGSWFGSERFGLDADIMTVAKGITSGYAPLGGVLIAPRIWERFYAGDDAPMFAHGVTYSGHATSCAIAEANLDILEREELVDRACTLESTLVGELGVLRESPDVAEIRDGCGLLAGVVMPDHIDAFEVAAHALELGVILRVLRGSILQISPPFVVSDDEVAQIVTTLGKAIHHARH